MTTKFDPAAPVIVDPPAIIRADTSRAEQAIDQIIRLDRSMAANEFDMADLWLEISEGDYFHADHCQSLPEFIKKHGFQLSPREITYRVKASRVCRLLDISRDIRMRAGWSKLKAVTQLDPTAEFEGQNVGDIMRQMMLDAGTILSLKDIQARVKEILGGEEDPDEIVKDTFAYTRSQKTVVDQAVDLATLQAGDTVDTVTKESKEISRGTAIHLIAADFLADPNNQPDIANYDSSQPSFEDEHIDSDDDHE